MVSNMNPNKLGILKVKFFPKSFVVIKATNKPIKIFKVVNQINMKYISLIFFLKILVSYIFKNIY